MRIKFLIDHIPLINRVVNDRDALLRERDDLLVELNKLYTRKKLLVEQIKSRNVRLSLLKQKYNHLLINNYQYQNILKIARKIFLDPKYKIKIAFFVNENQKWNCQSLYDELESHPNFEPLVLVSTMDSAVMSLDEINTKINKNYQFFKQRKIRVKKAYDQKRNYFISLKDFHCDIYFYQQPWGINSSQSIEKTSVYALCCYISYAFKLFNHKDNFLPSFHRFMWKIFLETSYHHGVFKRMFPSAPTVVVGYPKLDYFIRNRDHIKSIWKISRIIDPKIKRIIYAPHHSIVGTPFNLSTFLTNGELLLKLAQETPHTEWVFKPHPNLINNFSQAFPKKAQWIVDYFTKWENLSNAQIYDKGNYFDLFSTSDALITDSGSFLVEYLLMKKPVLHLRNIHQSIPFNKIGQKIISAYYQIYSNSELLKDFNRVIINNDDYLKKDRTNLIKLLEIDSDKTAAVRIIDHLEKELFLLNRN